MVKEILLTLKINPKNSFQNVLKGQDELTKIVVKGKELVQYHVANRILTVLLGAIKSPEEKNHWCSVI